MDFPQGVADTDRVEAAGRDGVEAFATRLVEQSGVLLLPASVYKSELGATPADRFRIGYGRDNMAAGLDAMRAHLRKQAA